jgi:hypothetical protein
VIYYIVKRPAGWQRFGREQVQYLDGMPSNHNWWTTETDARRFKSIAEIRSFMTRALKLGVDITLWIIEQHTVSAIPLADVVTANHTMAMLKR